MTRSRRIFRFLLAAAGILSALLVILVFLGPLLLNIKAVRDFAVSELGRRTGVRFSYGRVETTLFPRPRVVLRDAAFDIPGLAQGNIPNLETTPELTPLLRGRVRFGDLLVEGANFRLRIPPGPKRETTFSAEEIEGKLASFIAALEKNAPAKVVSIRNGFVELSDEGGPIVSLRELNATVVFRPERMTLSVRCASEYWEMLSVESRLHPDGLRGDARIDGVPDRGIRRAAGPGGSPLAR
jgi:hypothetical protein